MGDICKTDKLSEQSILTLAQMRLKRLCERSLSALSFTLNIAEDGAKHVAEKCGNDGSIKPMFDFVASLYKALAQHKLQSGADKCEVALLFEEDKVFAQIDKLKLDLMSLLPSNYTGALNAVKEEMDDVIGLETVKQYIFSLSDHYMVQQRRKDEGMKSSPLSMHMIFTGNPGTGKTTIARLVSKYLKAIGVLSGGQLIEVSRADLVGKYVGHTAPMTNQVIKSALGGVLFIDEAYALFRGKDDSFGMECIDTLVKGMEDNRDDLIVILAGYTNEMEVFMTANSGLRSRFPNIIEFTDYTGDELLAIAKLIAEGKGYRIEEQAEKALLDYFHVIQAMDSRESGNGRLSRNVIEKAILAQSKRIVNSPESSLDLLELSDFDLFETGV